MRILFVCKHNRFRSKVAEAIFNKLNKNKNILTKSAGLQLDLAKPYVCDNVKLVLKEKGYQIKDEKARKLDKQDLKWADKIIIVADNVSHNLFPDNKTEHWAIEDADERELDKIKGIIEKIEERVKKLIKG